MSGSAGAGSAPRYPLFLDLAGRAVLVVGGGPVAARRTAGLLAAGARVHVVAPQLCEELVELVATHPSPSSDPASLPRPAPVEPAEPGSVVWSAREGGASDVTAGPPEGGRWWLVHTATGDRATDAAIAEHAEALGIWAVRADRAEESAAHTPAVSRGPDGVQVAVAGGSDPGRAVAIRAVIDEALAAGRLPLRRTRSGADRGRVVLVGGGPGDPGLLTVRGRQWLARADVVVTDRLGPVGVLAELDPDVEVIDVGKTAGVHPIPQDEINRILVEQAQRGRTVVRLKGGDPYVLGRGAEEALHCLAHGVPVEVVPGVTSAVSIPAAAGIPVTHRGITTSFVVASGHAGAADVLEAARTAPRDATLVLLMGLSALDRVADELISAGRAPTTPVAVISRGWTPDQRTITGTLADIADRVRTAALPSPAVTVVGNVVALREALAPDPT